MRLKFIWFEIRLLSECRVEPRPRVLSTLTMKDCSSQLWLLVGVLESGRIAYLRH